MSKNSVFILFPFEDTTCFHLFQRARVYKAVLVRNHHVERRLSDYLPDPLAVFLPFKGSQVLEAVPLGYEYLVGT